MTWNFKNSRYTLLDFFHSSVEDDTAATGGGGAWFPNQDVTNRQLLYTPTKLRSSRKLLYLPYLDKTKSSQGSITQFYFLFSCNFSWGELIVKKIERHCHSTHYAKNFELNRSAKAFFHGLKASCGTCLQVKQWPKPPSYAFLSPKLIFTQISL